MIFTSLLTAAFLALSTGPAQDVPEEKTFQGTDETVIWFTSKKPRVKIETHIGFTFYLDFATHGALSLANMCAELKTKPKGFTLSFDPAAGMLSVDYDKEAKALRVLLGSSNTPVCSVPLPLTMTTTRVLLRQRDQLALYAIPQNGDHVTLVWLGSVGCMLEFRNAAQYELCNDLKITMGNREIPYDEFRKGVKLGALDQIENVKVAGTNPGGKAFVHHYTFDYDAIDKRADTAYTNFLRAAGNTLVGGEALDPKSSPGATPGTMPSSSPGPALTPPPSPTPASSATPTPGPSPATSPTPGLSPTPASSPTPTPSPGPSSSPASSPASTASPT